MKLTPRLELIAKEVEKGETIADIGTDHGYIPVWLKKNGISPKVILADISKGSLDKAKNTCKDLCPGEKFDLRQGDGLDVIDYGEVDCVVVAGLGGLLMREMFEWDHKKTFSVNKYVLQPRNNGGLVRKWLLDHGFEIVKEQLVREGRFICEIMTVISPGPDGAKKTPAVESTDSGDSFDFAEEIKCEFPDAFLECDRELLKEYLADNLKKIRFIKKKIEDGCRSDLSKHRDYTYICQKEERIEKLMGF